MFPPPRPTVLSSHGSRSPFPVQGAPFLATLIPVPLPAHSSGKPSKIQLICFLLSPLRPGTPPGAPFAPHLSSPSETSCSPLQAAAFPSSLLLSGTRTPRDTSFLEGASDLLEPPREPGRFPQPSGRDCQGCSPHPPSPGEGQSQTCSPLDQIPPSPNLACPNLELAEAETLGCRSLICPPDSIPFCGELLGERIHSGCASSLSLSGHRR